MIVVQLKGHMEKQEMEVKWKLKTEKEMQDSRVVGFHF